MSKKFLKGLCLASIATGIWASHYIVSRYIFGESEIPIDPVMLSFFRYSLAAFFFMALIVAKGLSRDALNAVKASWRIFAFLALSGIVLQGVLAFWALKYTTAARCSLFANMSPIFTVIMAVAVAGERLSWRKMGGMTIGFAGAAIAIISRSKGDVYSIGSAIIGDLLAIGSGICWSAYTIWGDDAIKKHGSVLAGGLPLIMGAAMLFAATLAASPAMKLGFSLKIWLAIIYLGLSIGVSYLCWYAALNYLKASELGAFGYISAALTALLSCLMLRESLSIWFVAALLCVIFGVYLMMRRDEEPQAGIEIYGDASNGRNVS